jgi:hypothetical protein
MTAPLVVVCLGVQKAAEYRYAVGWFQFADEVTHHFAAAAKK